MAGGVFSESWYRIANQQVSLRTHVQMRRQFFRGEKWYVLEDPFTNQFFRIRPEAQAFLARLRPDRTVEEVWKECLDRDPENAPGQEDVIRLLAQLYHANMLHYGLPEDSVKLFDRYKKRRAKELQSRLLGIMFMRIPLLDPDAFLRRTVPVVGRLFSRWGLGLWLGTLLLALKVVVDHWSALLDQGQGVLAPANLFLLYLSLVLIKVLHEFGHAYACRRFGGEVHTMGVMLLIFTPIPYMDATSSWAFRNRWYRALVGAAGMMVELFVAALAVFVWAGTGAGLLNSLAYNLIFIASVSTLLFNINPLLRFDGYYILSDLLDIPSLHTRASRQWTHLFERYLFGCRKSESPARTKRESVWLSVFGLLSGIYKVFVFTVIILFVADKFLLAGLIMALLCVVSLGIVPALKLIHYLVHSPKLERTRVRAISATAGLAVGILLPLWLIPVPHGFKAPGILRAESYADVSGEAAGVLEEILAPSGSLVTAGQMLFRLSDPELDNLLRMVQAEWAEAQARHRRALRDATADVEPLSSYLDALDGRRARLRQRKADLEVRAPMAGIWVAAGLEEQLGQWVPRGQAVGSIVGPDRFRLSAVIPQADAARLFEDRIGKAHVRLRGQSNRTLDVEGLRMVPADRAILPSAALGWFSGGDIQVSASDLMGRTAVEPFFEVFAALPSDPEAGYFHGRSGVIRFSLPAEPLLPRWIRAFRQLLQKRYRF